MTANCLTDAWTKRCKLRKEGDELYAQGRRLLGGPESRALKRKGFRLMAQANKDWRTAVYQTHGYVCMDWKNWDDSKGDLECHLPTGEIFKP